MPPLRRWRPVLLLVAFWLLGMYWMFGVDDETPLAYAPGSNAVPGQQPQTGHHDVAPVSDTHGHGGAANGGDLNARRWRKLPDLFPVTGALRELPVLKARQSDIPKIQAATPQESDAALEQRLQRQKAVRDAFLHSWAGYKKYAWLQDEVTPLGGKPKNPFGGWAATLVDALDTLWIMGLEDEFRAAVEAAETIDFSRSDSDLVNVFETTIRYLGGFLAAYELTGKKYEGLLRKAVEVGELLIYMTGLVQRHPTSVLVSELGSLSLEFTKLSQLTGDMKYYDAVQRISDEFEKGQDGTKLPGMWPVQVDPSGPLFRTDNAFTLGGMSDSLYEYFPKQYLILGGALEQPKKMYEKFIDVAKKHLMRRATNPEDIPIVIPGDARVRTIDGGIKVVNSPKGQHLTCFVGGMVGIASKIFNRPDELDLAVQLTDGCVWAYEATATGIMPEIFGFIPCGGVEDSQTGPECSYSDLKWRTAVRDQYLGQKSGKDPMGTEVEKTIKTQRLTPGMLQYHDKKYILRPEAIESVFIMYRLTGDSSWMDKAWTMFSNIERLTRTKIGAASLVDVSRKDTGLMDSMESFWLAETLKYFYLVFSDFDTVDLDTWVLNTEAHPLHRPDVE
ncbi:endoplasmic reticulum mannosyl-oligosaccharide 1,2-alpha-mannosidase [Diaporthe helianthi]|uniref:alpha-1,2-Mannosidase n=1 Tax=Diaporthe helianthi TaxID=158607 RepID=A0A2P5HI37_DIAHE|nr:endoplasmic reticulum mannosyl-oligosaccharide 1,2-alpha-mannosidase [Diaporthe helianthi]